MDFATGVVFGVAPIAQSAPELTAATLKEGGQRTTAGRHSLRRALVVCEVSLAVVLVVGAGLCCAPSPTSHASTPASTGLAW